MHDSPDAPASDSCQRHCLMFCAWDEYCGTIRSDESRAMKLVYEYRAMVAGCVAASGGRIVENTAEHVFAAFSGEPAAVEAARAILHITTLPERNVQSGFAGQVRIGLHSGEARQHAEFLLGDAVNIAARLEACALPGTAAISETVVAGVKDRLPDLLPLGVQPLKNIDRPLQIYLLRGADWVFRDWNRYAWLRLRGFVYRYRTVGAFLVLSFGILGISLQARLDPQYSANYVEILEFENESTPAQDDFLSAGFTEVVKAQISRLQNIYVVEAEQGLTAAIHVAGKIYRSDDRVSISYQLSAAQSGQVLAQGKVEGMYSEVFLLQDRMVNDLSRALSAEFGLPGTPARSAGTESGSTPDITAYEYYLQGLDYLSRPSSHDSFDRAASHFETSLVHDPEFAQAYAGLCTVYWRKYKLTNRPDWIVAARNACELALQRDAQLVEVQEAMAVIERDSGMYEEALYSFLDILKREPRRESTRIELAKLYVQMGREVQAETVFKALLADSNQNPELFRAYGNYLVRRGRYSDAEQVYLKMLELTASNAVAHNGLGVIYSHLGDFEAAADNFWTATRLNPSGYGYSNTGTMYYFSGKFAKAAIMFEKAAALEPSDYRLYVNLGDTWRHMPDRSQSPLAWYHRAVELIEQVLKENPLSVEANQYMAMSQLRLGDVAKADQYLVTAEKLEPKNPLVKYDRLRYLVAQRDFERSRLLLDDLIAEGYSIELLAADPDLALLRPQTEAAQIMAGRSR